MDLEFDFTTNSLLLWFFVIFVTEGCKLHFTTLSVLVGLQSQTKVIFGG